MLIPNLKFLVLPLVAVAVIAALPSSGTSNPQLEARATVVPAGSISECESSRRAPLCLVAMQPSATVVR